MRSLVAGGVVVVALISAPKADAAYIAYLYQDGSNVAATGSGSIDTTGLTFAVNDPFPAEVYAAVGYLGLGQTGGTAAVYTGPAGPVSFGSGSGFNASPSSGSIIGIEGTTGSPGVEALGLPQSYISGTDLGISTATWNSTTLAALGVTSGTYTWSWGSGPHADSYTLYVGKAPPIPEPTSMVLFGTGLAALGLIASGRARRQKARATA